MLQEQKSILRGGQFEANISGMNGNAFGDMVRSARERKGLRSYELASLMGRQASFLSRVETGAMKETPAPDVLRALTRHLGLSEAGMLKALGYLQDESDGDALQQYRDPDVDLIAESWEFLDRRHRKVVLNVVRALVETVREDEPGVKDSAA